MENPIVQAIAIANGGGKIKSAKRKVNTSAPALGARGTDEKIRETMGLLQSALASITARIFCGEIWGRDLGSGLSLTHQGSVQCAALIAPYGLQISPDCSVGGRPLRQKGPGSLQAPPTSTKRQGTESIKRIGNPMGFRGYG